MEPELVALALGDEGAGVGFCTGPDIGRILVCSIAVVYLDYTYYVNILEDAYGC